MSKAAADKKLAQSILHWRYNPVDWVGDIFPTVTLSTQQKHLLVELGKLYKAKKKRFYKEQMTDEERDYASKIGISVMSGHYTGKDFTAALVHNHFLMCFSFPKLICIANTGKQLRNVLHSEIVKTFRLSRKINPDDPNGETYLGSQLEIQSEKVFMKAYKGEEWFSEFATWNAKGSEEEQAETLAGRNAEYKLTIADEASGIPPAVFKPFEGSPSGIINILFVIFNPTRSKGFAVDSQYKNRERFLAFRWNSEESELTNKEAIKDLEKKYGRESNTFRMRVLGLPPKADADVLIPSDWIEDAKMRTFEPDPSDPILCGVDSGGGGDKSVHATRRGGTVLPFKRNPSPSPKEVGQWSAGCSMSINADKTFYEMDGLGRGTYYEAKDLLGARAVPVTMGGKAREDEKYANKRAECYMNFRQAFEDGTISLHEVADDQDFIDQLNALKKKIANDGRTIIVKKEELIAEIGHSPDESDATALTYALPENIFRKSKETKAIDAYDEEEEKKKAPGTWMGA